jgi:membrane protein required for colicin V production
MNWADIAILTIIGISAVISLFRGFVREALSLIGFILAVWVSITFYNQAADLLTNYVAVPTVRRVLGFVSLFVISLLMAGIINHLFGKLIDKAGLTGTDRMLGVIFGAIRGIAIVGVFVVMAGLTEVPSDRWWQESTFMTHFETLAYLGVSFLPPDIAPEINYSSP